MHLSCSGKTPTRKHKDQEKIYLIYQYFIPKDEARKKELQTCLKFNADNPHIDTIYLLNEKIYSKGELGIENDKIKQTFGNVVEMIVETAGAEEAVKVAQKLAESGEAVLLSPACASFDLFDNYEDRGRQFKQAVRSL